MSHRFPIGRRQPLIFSCPSRSLLAQITSPEEKLIRGDREGQINRGKTQFLHIVLLKGRNLGTHKMEKLKATQLCDSITIPFYTSLYSGALCTQLGEILAPMNCEFSYCLLGNMDFNASNYYINYSLSLVHLSLGKPYL